MIPIRGTCPICGAKITNIPQQQLTFAASEPASPVMPTANAPQISIQPHKKKRTKSVIALSCTAVGIILLGVITILLFTHRKPDAETPPMLADSTETTQTVDNHTESEFIDTATKYILSNYQSLMNWNNGNEIRVIDLNQDGLPELVFVSVSAGGGGINIDNIAFYYQGKFYTIPEAQLPTMCSLYPAETTEGNIIFLSTRIPKTYDKDSEIENFFSTYTSVTAFMFGDITEDDRGNVIFNIQEQNITWETQTQAENLYDYPQLNTVMLYTRLPQDGTLLNKPLAIENDTYEKIHELLYDYFHYEDETYYKDEALSKFENITTNFRTYFYPILRTNQYVKGTDTVPYLAWEYVANGKRLSEITLSDTKQQEVNAALQVAFPYTDGITVYVYDKAKLQNGFNLLWGTNRVSVDNIRDENIFYRDEQSLYYCDFGVADTGGSQTFCKVRYVQQNGDTVVITANVIEVTQFYGVYDITCDPEKEPIIQLRGNREITKFEEAVPDTFDETTLTLVQFVFQKEGENFYLEKVNY